MSRALTRPSVILAGVLAVHCTARVAALCGPGKHDSFLYSVAAYKFWQPDATADDLVSDKPPGQPILTGWCYLLASGPPSRLVLVPVESVFLLGGYLMFWVLARRLIGGEWAAPLTFLAALGHGAYGYRHGFNLNESYLLFPSLLAAWSHLTLASPMRRGFLRGLGLGLALSIKQTAIGVTTTCAIHGLLRMIQTRRIKPGLQALPLTLVGIAVVWAPMGGVLWARGWLSMHLTDLANLPDERLSFGSPGLPGWDKLLPLAPLMWLTLLGILAVASQRAHGRRGGRPGNESKKSFYQPPPDRSAEPSPLSRDSGECSGSDIHPDDSGHNAKHAGDHVSGPDPGLRRSVLVFSIIWLLAESSLIYALHGEAPHYYQQIVAPVALLAGLGLLAFAEQVNQLRFAARLRLQRWACVTTSVLALVACMPLTEAMATRVHRLNRADEIASFASWLDYWTTHPIGEAFREVDRD